MNNVLEILLKIYDILAELSIHKKEVLTFDDFCKYCNISEQHGYKLTSKKRVPHYCPEGKKLYFKRTELDAWMLRNPVKTEEEIESVAATKSVL